jgi:outer membrane protein OmpA-like peptidoglycan-associated protein
MTTKAELKTFFENGDVPAQEQFWEGYWLEKQEFNYLHVHADVLFNLSNILGGYKADRFYNINPYVGLGWMVTNDEPKQREVSANLGIYNTFRLSNAFNLTLDVRGGMVNDRFDGETGNRKNEGPLSAQIGFVYKFPKTDWNRNQTTIISYDEEELRILRRKVNELAQSNELLHKQLADSKHETVTDVVLKNKLLAAPLLVTFSINSSKVTNEARVNLGFFAKAINDNSKNVVYNVTGYADRGTGSPSTNERLSKERAQAIRDVLVNEFGVESRQIKISAAGGIENMHYNDPRLSRAVITYIE